MMRPMGKTSLLVVLVGLLGFAASTAVARPRSILLDTDVDADDFFALFYLLKQKCSEFDLKVDVLVGVGGDGVSNESGILPNVSGYLPLIEQGLTSVGYRCYRQAIPIGVGGRLHSDSNFGIRRGFLPQVLHSGIPITLILLDATNTIPMDQLFFAAFSHHQTTYEAQYCFQSLKMAHDAWFVDMFYSDGYTTTTTPSLNPTRWGRQDGYTREVNGSEAVSVHVA